MSKCYIVEKVWGFDVLEMDVVRSYMYILRNVIDKLFDILIIKMVYGIGFRFIVK